MTLLGASVVVLWIVTAVTVLAVAGLVRQNKVLEAHVRRLGVTPAASRAQPTPDEVRRLADGAATLVAFYVDAHCPSCDRILAAAPKLAANLAPRVRIVIVPLAGTLVMPESDVLVAEKSSPLRVVDIPATPYAIAWTGQGAFRSAAPVGSEEAMYEFLNGVEEGAEA